MIKSKKSKLPKKGKYLINDIAIFPCHVICSQLQSGNFFATSMMMLIVMMFGIIFFFRLADKDRGKCFGGVARLVTAVTNHALIICK